MDTEIEARLMAQDVMLQALAAVFASTGPNAVYMLRRVMADTEQQFADAIEAESDPAAKAEARATFAAWTKISERIIESLMQSGIAGTATLN